MNLHWMEKKTLSQDRLPDRLRDCPCVGAGRIICRYHWPTQQRVDSAMESIRKNPRREISGIA